MKPDLLNAIGTRSLRSLTNPRGLAIVAGAAALTAAGCTYGGDPIETETAPLPEGTQSLGEFVLHLRPKLDKYWIERVTLDTDGKPVGPGLSPQSIDEANLVQDGVVGGPTNSVELVTNTITFNCANPSPPKNIGSGNTLCANVRLNSYYTRPLSNVFTQVTSITDSMGVEYADQSHSGFNSVASQFGLTNFFGLWQYTSSVAGTPAGVLGGSSTGANNGVNDWVFGNPDDESTDVYLRVLTSLSYASYAQTSTTQTLTDACTSGTQLGKVTGTQSVPLPFQVTLYGTTSNIVRFNYKGHAIVGSGGALDTTGTNKQLPSNTSPRPGIFVFWDNLKFGTSASSQMCHLTTGSAPNRQFVVTWRRMDFVEAADDGANLNFEMTISEGSNAIRLSYGSMTGPTSRASGTGATVGVQDSNGTTATGTFNVGNYGSSKRYTMSPSP